MHSQLIGELLPVQRSSRALGNQGDPVVVATSGRSGTHLLIDTIRYQFPEFALRKRLGEPVSAMFVPLEEVAAGVYPLAVARRTLDRANRAIIRSHDWPNVLSHLRSVDAELESHLHARAHVVCVVRDPLVAFPKLWALAAQQFRWTVGASGHDDFVAQTAIRWAEQVRTISGSPRSMFIRLEDMLDAPAREITRLGAFLNTDFQLREPMLIKPHRNRLESGLTRLSMRPRSTHALLRKRVRTSFKMEWTEERLAILDRHAGDAMQFLSYRRPIEPAIELKSVSTGYHGSPPDAVCSSIKPNYN